MDDVALTLLLCRALGGLPGWLYLDDGEYPDDVVAVHYGALRSSPDRGVGVRVYGGDDPLEDPSVRRVQLRFRGPRLHVTGADELAGQAFGLLQGATHLPGVSLASRISFGPFGADSNQREERTDNYQIILDNTEAATP